MIRSLTLTLTLTLTWTWTFTFTLTFTSPAHAEEPPADPAQPPPPAAVLPSSAAPPAETVVRAAAPPSVLPRADQAATVSVVLPDESPRAYDDLGALLAEVPGVNIVRTGSLGKLTTITLRGSNPDQVRIYVDGVPINIAAGGGVDVSTLPIGDIERVEVYRGASPLEFGESALGGIISITTRTPGAVRASARSGAGSF